LTAHILTINSPNHNQQERQTMAKWQGYFKVVKPKPTTQAISNNQDISGGGGYGNYTWYQRLVQGSSTRLTRYREYDLMDDDVEVARALDTIAEEMTGNNDRTDLPMDLDMQIEEGQQVPPSVVMTLRASLRHWTDQHDWENRLFKVARNTIKYGDIFFRKKAPRQRWEYIHPKSVVAALVNKEDVTKIDGWQLRVGMKKVNSGSSSGMSSLAANSEVYQTELVPAGEIVRFSLNDDMSPTAPFGESILRTVFRSHRQKELLEDAILIYRIQRAPERRVFYIDVGKMPPQRSKQYLEQIKNEIRQKKIPTNVNGKDSIDSVYNPQSMSEDFFFAQRPDGRGSRVETLPGGQGLGELTDLEYFQDKVFRGLRVPISWMKSSADNAIFNDGKVGTAYIEELRFALYVMRLQGYVEMVLDQEFKRFLRDTNIQIDETMYKIRLPAPSNFGVYRQQEVDAQLLSSYSTADGISHLSKRFILKRYLQLEEDEILTNERLMREEKGLDPNGGSKDLASLYNPDAAEMEGGEMGDLGDPGDAGAMTAGDAGDAAGDAGDAGADDLAL